MYHHQGEDHCKGFGPADCPGCDPEDDQWTNALDDMGNGWDCTTGMFEEAHVHNQFF